jgi:ribonucleoside-diphosphate reductase alpha chain
MRISRRYTEAGKDIYESIEYRVTSSEIRNPDGSVVFKADEIEVPAGWSQVACDILAQKYFRKRGVPLRLRRVEENDVPSWLWRSVPDDGLSHLPKDERSGGETSAKQVFHRLAGTWTYWGWKGGYFDSEDDARAYYDEMRFMLARQMGAPNSPQWFNTGLHWAYGIDGPSQGHYFVDHRNGAAVRSASAYERPQPHACFIQSVGDDLVNENGIMDLWVREARLFKYGSGTGTNFSHLRGSGEPLSGGGKSSGLMSFLKIGDRAAGAIKSGGTTRRAAKMVCVDIDHPDIADYIAWKVVEEQKVASLVTGSKLCNKHLNAIIRACHAGKSADEAPEDAGRRLDPKTNPLLKTAIQNARAAMIPDNYIQRVIQFAGQGYETIEFKVYDTDWDSDAYLTVSGQNSNNSVRVPNAFIEAVLMDGEWELTQRTDGAVAETLQARELWDDIAYAAWACADPGVQFDTTINEWHTCPRSGRINASNPCSEYMFLDDTACNLASLNLMAFRTKGEGASVLGSGFDVAGYEHAVRLWTVTLEIAVLMAQFPSRRIAELSYEYRTLGLGYANLGGLLMARGLSYDSDHGRAVCAALSAILTGVAYATSAEMAGELGPFPGYEANRDDMLRVIRNHRLAAHGNEAGYDRLSVPPVPLDAALCPDPALAAAARAAWDRALELGEAHGYRNAQASVVAPTGTIGLVMDCDTTGIEPDFAVVKFKKLAGGGYFKIINRTVPEALRTLGYDEGQIEPIIRYAVGLHRGRAGHPGRGPGERLRHQVRLQQVDPGRGLLHQGPGHRRGRARRRDLRPPGRARLRQGRSRGRQRLLLRRHDPGRRSGPQGRASYGLRLCQSMRAQRYAIPLGREPYPHDGGRPALHLGRDLQNHQHAQPDRRAGLQGRLHAVLAPGPQGECPLPRRLQALAAHVLRPVRPPGRGRHPRRPDYPGTGGRTRRDRRRAGHRASRGACEGTRPAAPAP